MADLNVLPETAQGLSSEITAYMNAHMTRLHWTLRGVIALSVVAFGLVFWVTLHSYQKSLDAANAQYAVLEAQYKETTVKLSQDAVVQAQNNKQVQIIDHVVTVRDTQASQEVAQVTAPDATLQQVADNSAKYLQVVPVELPDKDLLAYTPGQVQGFIATGIEKDAAVADGADTKKQLVLVQDNEGLLKSDLNLSQSDLTVCRKTVADYRKVTRKQKWLRRLEVVGAFAAGYFLHTPLP